MKTLSGDGGMKSQQVTKQIGLVVLSTALILLVPLVAMQFTNEVDWDLFDFVVAGTLLAGTGLMYVMAARKLARSRNRAIVGAVLLVALALVWVELAVGIVGS